jgi:replication-associated recombination protein RarA
MFNKLKNILIKDGIKTPEYQQIFNDVIDYEDIKLLLYKMITSKYTNSVLLIGPPASSKTVFILELLDHFKGKAYFVDGTTASGMGMIYYLFDHADLKFLVIDEIDKLNKKDQKVLLNVMETGILSDVSIASVFHAFDGIFELAALLLSSMPLSLLLAKTLNLVVSS